MNDPKTQDPTRSVTAEISVNASPEAVWKALTDAEELTRWFPLEARVTPGEGGQIWMAWGEMWRGDSRIEIWEPNRHLRTSSPIGVPKDAEEGGASTEPVRLAIDFFIEGRGGETRLRVVHSGFGRGESWDTEYDGVRRGWAFELRSLRHYLERHSGEDRQVAWALSAVGEASAEEAWDRLMSDRALLAEGDVKDAREGGGYAIRTVMRDRLQGTVLVNNPGQDFAGTVGNLNDGIFRVGLEPTPEGPHAILWLATYGVGPERVAELQGNLETILERSFPGVG